MLSGVIMASNCFPFIQRTMALLAGSNMLTLRQEMSFVKPFATDFKCLFTIFHTFFLFLPALRLLKQPQLLLDRQLRLFLHRDSHLRVER